MTSVPLIQRYAKYLPVSESTPIISLNEGDTPLIRANTLSATVGAEVFLKFEGANPTGSFKDRGMTVAVSKAVEEQAEAVICASTGNTAASAAAYAARAGLRCLVLLPEGNVALGKLAQAVMAGAEVLQVQGNFDQALDMVRELTERFPIECVNSVNPYRIAGQSTGAFEIVDELGRAPDYHAIPVGNAGNITAYWSGYQTYHTAGKLDKLPVMLGFQAAGAAPIVRGHPIEHPETIASAIRIGNPASWAKAVAARDESGGAIEAVTDDEILAAYRLLASREGVFCEPASAAGVAGVLRWAKQGHFQSADTIVCVLTGHGLKDPDTAMSMAAQMPVIPAETAAVIDYLGWKEAKISASR